MYLTIDEYEELTGKDVASEYDYMRSEYRARVMINILTFNRLTDEKPVREVVKMLMVELISNIEHSRNADEQSSGGTINSVSNDGVSISYSNGAATEDITRNRCNNIIREYLANEVTADGTPLLSRWVYA